MRALGGRAVSQHHGFCRLCQGGRGGGGLRGRVVLTTSGMWTDENRLLQKLHQEAGEGILLNVPNHGAGDGIAMPCARLQNPMRSCLQSTTCAMSLLFEPAVSLCR